jgi:hypothetical protein
MTNSEGSGSCRLCPNFKVISQHFLEKLRKSTIKLSQDNRHSERDLKVEIRSRNVSRSTTTSDDTSIQNNKEHISVLKIHHSRSYSSVHQTSIIASVLTGSDRQQPFKQNRRIKKSQETSTCIFEKNISNVCIEIEI